MVTGMQLEPEDERILAGEEGETRQKMLELLVALGKVFGAERLVEIKSAQVSGASYKTIGKYGLEWLTSLDAKAVVPAILNPIGMPRGRWEEMGIDPDFAEKQQAVVAAYERLGIRLDCTCTPYYLYETRYGDHLAWSESSAVSYANSVLGARTNREGGPSALAAALVGKTPCYGLHLAKNRVPQMVIDVHADTSGWGIAEYGALGFYAGKLAGNRIPYFRSIRRSPTSSRRSALRWRQPGRLRSTMSRERLLRRRKTGSIFPDLIPSRSNRPRSRACFQISRWTPWRSAARTALPRNLQRSPGSSPGKS